MKHTHFSTLSSFLSTSLPLLLAVPAFAAPFSVTTLPAGFDAPDIGGNRNMFPIAADFLKNGRLQWYQGGNVITRYPEAGTLTLPAITLPQTPAATVLGLTGAACDVDRDGDLDLVRINQWNGNAFEYTLQVFLNNGGGSFSVGYRLDWTNSLPWNEGTHYLKIVPADYNMDGAPDLAILETYGAVRTDTDPDRHEGRLLVRWNDGTGGFGTSSTLQASGLTGSARISSADYDRDGDPDILCSEYTTYGPDEIIGSSPRYDRSLLFSNDGDSTFTVGNNFPSLMPACLLDLNGDGWADLADSVNKAMNNGAGAFGAPGRTSGSNGAYVSTFADLDDDGLPELIYADGSSLFWQTPDGSPAGYQGTLIAALPATPNGIGAADSDGDGDVDLFASLSNGSFAFVENRQLHTVPGATLSTTTSLSGITGLHGADFNRDGYDDVLAVTPSQEKWWIIPGQSNGIPGTPAFRVTHSEAAHSAAVADFDRDGQPDVAYTVPSTGHVYVAHNNGSINPLNWAETTAASGLTGVSLLVSGSMGTPNGRPDLFTANGTTGQVRALYQSGSSWNGQTIYGSLNPVPGSIAAGEVSGAPGSEIGVLYSSASDLNLSALRLSGGWTQHGTLRTESITGGPHAAKMIWADGNGDRFNEGIYINGNGDLVAWLPVGNFTVLIGSSPSRIRDFTAVDWDGDGRNDFLCATDAGLCLFHYVKSLQQWQRTELFRPAVGGYTSVATLHINRDGHLDAVAASSVTGNLQYFRNTPNSVRADLGTLPTSVNVTIGTNAHVFTLPLLSGAHSSDPTVAMNRCELAFHEAVAGPGGTWVPGNPLGQNNVTAYFTSAGLHTNGNLTAAKDPNNITGGGRLFLDNDAPGCVPGLIPAGNSLGHSLFLDIASANAIQTNSPRFFVTVKSLRARPSFPGSNNSPGSGDPALLENVHPILVNVVPPLTALQEWRMGHFGTWQGEGNTGNDADFDGDGVPNLVEYFYNTNPKVAENALNAYFGLTLLKNPAPELPVNFRVFGSTAAMADPKLRVTIQYATGDLDSWNLYATRTGGGSWTGVTIPTVLPPSDGRSNVFFTTTIRPKFTPKYFLRLMVEELP